MPITAPGVPSPVDVYIDDGRNGEYDYESDFWENQNIWNRLAPDGGLAHQTPVLSIPNYVYVKVGNRGQQAASGVIVRGFHCKPSSGLVWPDDWAAMDTPELSVSGTIPAGGSTIVGPFQWTPQVAGHECLLMYVSATGDISNADPSSLLPCASGPAPHWRLVPNDNNIGQRNVAPVPGGGGGLRLNEAFRGRRFSVDNPYERQVKVDIEASLPAWLAQLGWSLRFISPGGNAFRLSPRASREVVFDLIPGRDFTARDVRFEGGRTLITIRARIEGTVVGGMSYQIDPALKQVPREHAQRERARRRLEAAEELLESFEIDANDVKNVRIKGISIEIET